jgi:vacuolar-type H+-ATPase catalytic subunit A/Vma1
MITEIREYEMYDNWMAETSDDWTQEWRDELNEEEEKLVDEWENQYYGAYVKLCNEISKHIK